MSAQTNERLVRSTFDAFNAHNFDEAARHVADKCEWRSIPTGELFRGPDGMRQFMQFWVSAFKDARVDVKRVIATDTHVVTEFIGRGTHTGTLETPAGSIPATNRRVEVPYCEVATIENGKFVSGATYFDTTTIMQQLGVTELAGAHK